VHEGDGLDEMNATYLSLETERSTVCSSKGGMRNGNPERVGMVREERKRKESERFSVDGIYVGGLGRALPKAAQM
jgi:hypothetical protein